MATTLKFNSKLAGFRSIARRNKAFDSLTGRQQRQEIAWDALQLLMKGKVKPHPHGYWDTRLQRVKGKTPEEFQQNLIAVTEEKPCMVCARGLLMLSQIRVGNTIDKTDDCRDKGSYHNVKGFEINDFYHMESDYEQDSYLHPYHRRTKEKLANMCINIIKNGNFDINDSRDYISRYNIKL